MARPKNFLKLNGKLISEWRNQRGLSQNDLIRENPGKISLSTLGRIERGNATSRKNAELIASILDVSTNTLIQKPLHGEILADTNSLSSENVKGSLFHFPGGAIDAIRLWGASKLCVRPGELKLTYAHIRLAPPVDSLPGFHEYISSRREASEKSGKEFFNGVNTRLLSFRGNPLDDSKVGLEEPVLELRLGPVSWYEYSFLNARGIESRREEGFSLKYLESIGWNRLVSDFEVDGSKLSNILDTATTIITSDGFATYCRRLGRVDVSSYYYTSAVAENVNRFKDECYESPAHVPIRSWPFGNIESGVDYNPLGLPSPIAAIRRGIEDEVSPMVSTSEWESSFRVTGVTFDLVGGHPDILAMVLVPHTKDELFRMKLERPGREMQEGELLACPLKFEHSTTRSLLQQPKWNPSGKASLVRSLEIFSEYERTGLTFDQTFFKLISGEM